VHCGLHSYHSLAQRRLHFFLNWELKAISTQAVPVLLYILIILTHEKNEILLTHIQTVWGETMHNINSRHK
jgi:hypothetical protein